MKLLAVLDSSVVISAIGWRGEARNVLRLLARRGFISIRTPYLTREWTETLTDLSAEPDWPNTNWASWLEWLNAKSRLVDDPPMKRIVRDPKDDPILAAAISQSADYVVSHDKDLLDLERPYGVRCVRPRAFIAAVLAQL
jgi:putative PIN family toxin of toxin-antitoxin system